MTNSEYIKAHQEKYYVHGLVEEVGAKKLSGADAAYVGVFVRFSNSSVFHRHVVDGGRLYGGTLESILGKYKLLVGGNHQADKNATATRDSLTF